MGTFAESATREMEGKRVQTVGARRGRGSTAGATPARWAAPGVAAVVMVSPHWPTHTAPGLAVAITAVAATIAGSLPPGGVGRWFRFGWRRCTALWGRAVADSEMPIVIPAARSPDPAAPGAAPPIDVLVHGGRLLAVVELRPGGIAGRPASGLEALEPLLVSAGVVVQSIQWLQVSTHRRGAHLVGDRRWSRTDSREVSGERTLVVLRIDPGGIGSAIDARGGGGLGARRVVAVTVARAVSLLAPAGGRPRLLDGAAALRVISEVGGTPPPGPWATRRQSRTEQIEFRDRLSVGGRQHRMWHWHGGFRRPDERPIVPPATIHGGVHGTQPAGGRPAQVVRSTWMAAGPDGIRRGGAIRVSAGSVAELEGLDRALRQQVAPDGATLRDAVDDQAPLFAATLPYGGPW